MALTKTYKNLYWALISTFILLYLAIAFVSTLHAITFFQITNALWLAIMLGAAYEIGQATVLFSILMTENKNKMLAWLMMILLTSLQVTANVYASFMYMDNGAGNDWVYWQRSILFWVEADSPEMYKIIISWISGALLPLVALGMTALVADNVQYTQKDEKDRESYKKENKEKESKDENEDEEEKDSLDEAFNKIGNLFKKKNKQKINIDSSKNEDLEKQKQSENKYSFESEINQEDKDEENLFDESMYDQQDLLEKQKPIITPKDPTLFEKISKNEDITNPPLISDPSGVKKENVNKDQKPKDASKGKKKERKIPHVPKEERTPLHEGRDEKKEKKIEPVNKQRGWHLKKRYVDNDGNVFSKGKYIGNEDPSKPDKEESSQSKKAQG